jgi:transposase
MDAGTESRPLSPEEVTRLVAERDRLGEENRHLHERLASVEHHLDWFKRQLFGEKSERRLPRVAPEQMSLGEGWADDRQKSPAPTQRIGSHTRKAPREKPAEEEDEAALFFDERVPVQIIEVSDPDLEGLAEDDYAVIGEKVSYRLAQRPGSYVILKYVRRLIKRRDDQSLHCPPAPSGVFDHSRADVSFIAGLLVDKFVYHQPLYRQHQRLTDNGIDASRPWLTDLVHRAAALLEPVYEAQFDSVRASRVKAMDETPIKAGRKGKGKMKTGYFWPVYGECEEIVFPFFPSRGAKCVFEALGHPPPGAPPSKTDTASVLISDGYSAYARYAEASGLTHAQCWAHTRRQFIRAENAEPEASARALELIGGLYAVEAQIRDQGLEGEKKHCYRVEQAKPVAERLFAWAEQQMADAAFLPSNPLTKALGYLLERRAGLEVYLADAEVPIDTNHLERALRVIPMGRKNFLFCWTEVGAKYVGILQSLLVTCRMHAINPYDYLVDVLQRINQHPASEVHLLTPRLWKQHFADNPLRSPLHDLGR